MLTHAETGRTAELRDENLCRRSESGYGDDAREPGIVATMLLA